MRLRISATYATTDKSAPESVEVEFDEVDQEGTFDVDLGPILGWMLTGPARIDHAVTDAPFGLRTGREIFTLDYYARAGDILGVGRSDGDLHNIGSGMSSEKFDRVAPANEALSPGDRVMMVTGVWVKA